MFSRYICFLSINFIKFSLLFFLCIVFLSLNLYLFYVFLFKDLSISPVFSVVELYLVSQLLFFWRHLDSHHKPQPMDHPSVHQHPRKGSAVIFWHLHHFSTQQVQTLFSRPVFTSSIEFLSTPNGKMFPLQLQTKRPCKE